MVHAPCGEMCQMEDVVYGGHKSRCRKNYPYPFCAETVFNPKTKRVRSVLCPYKVRIYNVPNSQVQYRRRDDGDSETVRLRGQTVTVDNRVVVPHNRFIMQKYGMHVNVEVIMSKSAPKYLLCEFSSVVLARQIVLL